MEDLLYLIPLLPLIAFVANILLGRGYIGGNAHWVAIPAVAASWILALVVFQDVYSSGEVISQHLFTWIPSGDFVVDVNLYVDQLTATMLLVVLTVGLLVHVYSVGYMQGDPGYYRFFAYLPLFVFSMLMLVLADNLLVLFVFWEAVGLCSYLLIGYYFRRRSANNAARKAFIVNRIGDLGFGLGVMLAFWTFGTIAFHGENGIFEQAMNHEALGIAGGTLTAIGILLFIGACGKSAQFPLHVWLPDAMEGPTPVSALIHAATMVTAGVYLIARATPIYEVTDTARLVVGIIGAVTILIGAVIGCAYDDIKKVLAYSTVSQIGYMFLAVSIPGAGAIAILHLLTHGFFKACMFLSAGSVMHGMNDQVDMRRFGGLRTAMPVTFGCMLVGYLAIIGVPPFAGFFSKDLVIEAAFDQGGTRGWVMGSVAVLAAGLTAFYMTRLMLMTFFGEKRWTDDVHPHESPPVMTGPMVLLGIGSVLSGFVLLHVVDLERWLEPVTGVHDVEHVLAPIVVSLLTLAVVAAGVFTAYTQYAQKPIPTVAPHAVTPLTVAARRNLYFDALNENVLMRPGQYLTRALVFVDNRGIDGAVNTLAAGVGGGSGRLRRIQNGFVRSYALSMFGGAALVVASLLAVRVVSS